MNKRKIAAIVAAAVTINFSVSSIEALASRISKAKEELASTAEPILDKEDIENASELVSEQGVQATTEAAATITEIETEPIMETTGAAVTATISKFDLLNSSNIGAYNEIFKMDNSNIESITSNGGNYNNNSSIENAIDGNFTTHWETKKQNKSDFTNEVVFKLNEETTLNRIVYAARQSSAKGKGFAKELEIYGSLTDGEDDFTLVSSGEYKGSTGDVVEIKFNPTKFKRIKFVFKKADQDWASASEFMFYKEDKLSDKMDRLFTDDTMSEINEEFNSIEEIDALEEEVKNHPLYSDFKEYIENARELLNDQNVEATTATTKQFEHYSNEEYSNLFKMDNNNIKSISNNGGYYSGQVITNAIDGNVDTYWETNTSNKGDFTNEVEVEFKDAVELNRIVYGARKSDRKGFAQEFEIYGSTTSKGDTYKLVATGSHNKVSGLVEAKFNPTKFKRVKFKFKNSDQNWATLSEIAFYKQDVVSDKIDNLFTNGLRNELSEDFNTKEKLQALENETKGHPLESSFKEPLELAKEILNGELSTVKVITAEQHGDMVAHAKNNLKFGFGNNNQPTGISAKPGDVITVYVDADPSKPLPSLAFSQQEGSFGNWMRTVSLKVGKNVIAVPEIPQDGWYKHEVTKGGPIYIVNPYTKEEQPKAPVIRFASGDKFPFLTKDTNEEEFKKFLIEYKKAMDEDIAKNPNVLDRKVLDIFEFVSDHLVWTGTATGAYKTYIEQGVNPLDTIKSYNTHMEEIFKYYGLDGSSEQNDPKYIRENVRLAQPFAYMYSYTNHIGVLSDVMANHLIPFEDRGPSWGLTHEIGHRMDVNARLYGEITNNMLPMHMSVYYNKIDNRIPYESKIYKNVISENSNKYADGEAFERLAVYWQLEMYKPGYWGNLNKLYRERNVSLGDKNPENVKMQYLIKFSSEVIGEDLSEYFARHGFEVNEETKKETIKYPKPDKKIWYLNNSKANYKGNGFTQDTNLEVSLNKVENGIKLTFDVDDKVKPDLLGYEILRDGEVIGFTGTNTFTDTNADKAKNSKYEVVPYDLNLGTGKSVSIYQFTPNINIQQNKITLKLKEEFNPMDYIKVLDYEGNDITSKVEAVHNVDTSKKGVYQVKYTVNDDDVVAEKIVEVEVVSDYDYLSDEEWTSVKTEWGTPRRNSSIKGRVNGELKEFEKGFGIHANGTITYDLSDKDYDNFEALLGVDLGIEAQNNSSIKFEIIGDDKVLATTDVLKHADNMVYINVPVKGVKELVIKVTDAGDRNTSDHSVIANPKLTTNNAKPKLTIPKSVSTKVGEVIDLNEKYSAIDAEDGDITDKVQVTGKVNFNKTGKYPITYTVIDNDGNEVVKTRTIAVVNMNDYRYLTDYDWTSTKNSYANPKKDISNGNNTLRLTNENGKEVSFERGIGAHSNSTITYDLTDKDYAYFSSYVGVDREMFGTVGSVTFEVYVDGEKKFDSKLMKSKDPMKYLEVDINGAKELKLVVTDGGNGIGSDHATWGDAKLHFVNEIQSDYEELETVVETAKTYEKDKYTEKSFEVLEEALKKAEAILRDKVSSQDEIDSTILELNGAISNLEENVDINQVITIKDEALKNSIKETLNLSSDDITLGNMDKLTELSCSDKWISSLEGLEYAKNLELLDVSNNQIKDLSPLKNLKKLTNLNANPQVITEGMLYAKDNKITLDYKVLNRNGEKLKPKEIIIRSNRSNEAIDLSLDKLVDENGVISFDISDFDKYFHSMYVIYEDKEDNFLTQSLYMFNVK
ncbi:MAG: NPCBM/NEW2 domain-containing protein [Clostridium neonatale]